MAATAAAKREDRTPSPTQPAVAADDYLGIFQQAGQIVQENYVRDNFNGVDWDAVREAYRPQVQAVQSQDEFWDVMEAFIAELNDDHSRFVRPGDFAAEFGLADPSAAPDDAAWTGLWIWPAREDEQLVFWYVCDEGPAARAGLQRGDQLLAVNDRPVPREGYDPALVRQAMFGESGSSVTLTVQQGPDSAPEDVALAYGPVAGCDGWQLGVLSREPYIGYLRVPDFGGDADVNIQEGIRLLEEDGPLDGLVVDVRHNPGGNADRSIAIFTTGVFGEVGPLREGATQTIYRIRGPVRWNETTPVAVLTDGSSHSAAEYFSTAMQQSGRALIVGQPTAGNTEGITGFSLPDGSLIRLAVSTLQLPDESTLEGTGVIPDISVPLGLWGLREIPDLQLQAATSALLGE
jgi:C-terminal peptidase prc